MRARPAERARHGRSSTPLALIVVVVLAAVSCTPHKPGPGGGATISRPLPSARVDTTPLTGKQSLYGASPHPDKSIKLQPDVVLIGGGAEAVQSVSADGMVWTLTASAGHVADLQVGKIMFATGFGVGRVLALRANGTSRVVVLGPVDLTDIIRDGTLATPTPVPLTGFEAYTTPTRPGLVEPNSASKTPDNLASGLVTLPVVNLVGHAAPAPPPIPPLGVLPPPTGSPGSASAGDYDLSPSCCSEGLGVNLLYDHGGMRVDATLNLHLHAPTATFNVKIAHGALTEASVELRGAFGFGVDFKAATSPAWAGNISHQRVQVPVTFSIPLMVLGFPLTARLEQFFTLTTGFSDKATALHAAADFTLSGGLGFGLHNGSFGLYVPSKPQPTENVYDTITGVTLSVSALSLGYAARLSVGVGLLGFEASAWVKLSFALAVVAASPVSLVPSCRAWSVDVQAAAGVGYRIPQLVADVVNFFLGIFHAQPIVAHADLSSKQLTLRHMTNVPPGTKPCT